MADTVIDVVSKSDFAAAQNEIADLRKRLEAAKEDQVKEQTTALEKTIATRDEEIKTLKTEIDNTKASKKDLEKSLETVKADAEAVKTKLVEAEAKLAENQKSVVKANRISALVDKGVDKAEAEKIVDAAVAANDELFTVILDTHAKLVEVQKASAAAACDPEMDGKGKMKKKEKQAAKADEQKLEEVEVEGVAPLSAEASTDTETDSVVAGLADFLSQELVSKKNK